MAEVPPSIWFLLALVIVLAVGDLLFNYEFLPGGTISRAVARWYAAGKWARVAFWVGSILLLAVLDWHFATHPR